MSAHSDKFTDVETYYLSWWDYKLYVEEHVIERTETMDAKGGNTSIDHLDGRTKSDRFRHQFIGWVCEAAFSLMYFHTLQPFLDNKARERTKNYKSDGADYIGTNIDVKGRLNQYRNSLEIPPEDWILPVQTRERTVGICYVLAVVDDIWVGGKLRVRFMGYAKESELGKPMRGGPFKDACVRKFKELHPMSLRIYDLKGWARLVDQRQRMRLSVPFPLNSLESIDVDDFRRMSWDELESIMFASRKAIV